MSRAQKALSVLVVACLGLWGCAQGAANGHASAQRMRALETKIAKLETDFRSVVSDRDQLRKLLVSTEQERDKLRASARECDQLRQLLTVRTGERDSVQNQFDQFRKEIRTLLGRAEASAASNTPALTVASQGSS
jgi:predicted  nucleic acid-binding Zn-ribbon protein